MHNYAIDGEVRQRRDDACPHHGAQERELSSAKNTKSSDSSRRRYDGEDDYSEYAEKYASYEDEA